MIAARIAPVLLAAALLAPIPSHAASFTLTCTDRTDVAVGVPADPYGIGVFGPACNVPTTCPYATGCRVTASVSLSLDPDDGIGGIVGAHVTNGPTHKECNGLSAVVAGNAGTGGCSAAFVYTVAVNTGTRVSCDTTGGAAIDARLTCRAIVQSV